MGSKTPPVLTDQVKSTVNASTNRSTKVKVPKRINKSAREKLKREHLNDLFLELANTLDLNQPNKGKASILCEAARFLKDLFGQIESLRTENASLLSESHYVNVEKNELKEEKSMLETRISELRTEIEAKVNQSKPDLNVVSLLENQPHSTPTTLLVLPVQPEFQSYHISDITQRQIQTRRFAEHSSNVRKPHPRYPSEADSWQFQLLEERLRASDDLMAGGKSSNDR